MTALHTNVKTATMNDVFYNHLIKEVTESERECFLLSKFDGSVVDGLNFEQNMYGITSHSCEGYDGGYWDFVNLKDSKGFFMHLSKDDRFKLSNQNYNQEYSVDGRVLGLIMTMMLFSHASFSFHESKPRLSQIYAEHYHQLRDAFYGAVDSLAYGVRDEYGEYIQNDNISNEVKDEIKEMASVVHAYLD